jgi:hypothetical protein
MLVKRSIRSAAVLAVCVIGGAITSAVLAAGAETFGKGLALKDATPLTSVLSTPSTYEGKTVRVEGVVTSVCEEMGCWLALAPTDVKGDQTLIIQVEHGVVVFPLSAKGRRAAAEGIVQRVGSRESRAAAEEHARQEGKSAADAGKWQIKATGALLF